MKRGTTPTHTFTVDVDLTEATVYITYVQNKRVIIEKTNADIDISATKLVTQLSQEETLLFQAGQYVEIQIRYVKGDGSADASDIMRIDVERLLKEGVI